MSPLAADIEQADVDAETQRLHALYALDLLDTDPEKEFDSLVALAARLVDCPTALLTLVDRDRQWIKAAAGDSPGQLPRDVAFCHHTIRGDGVLAIEDATRDTRFAQNPLVTGEAGVRFYAGMPIHAPGPDGSDQAIGAICVIDRTPRRLSEEGREALRNLATLAESLIAARTATRKAVAMARLSAEQATALSRRDRIFRQAERLVAIGAWRLQISDNSVEWSDNVYRIYGLAVGEKPALESALEFYPPHARATVSDALTRTIETGVPFEVETDFRTARGEARRVRSVGELEIVDGVPVAIVGVFQDVTDRHALEQSLRRSADRDELTGLANRAAFNRELDTAMADAHRHGTPLLLALIDLDGFKRINDTLGHLAGDDVLRAIGHRLRAPWLERCFAARLGGDEFALIIDTVALLRDTAIIVRRLEAELAVPVRTEGAPIATSGTVGAALLAPDLRNVRDFFHRADTALYAAKRRRMGERRRTG